MREDAPRPSLSECDVRKWFAEAGYPEVESPSIHSLIATIHDIAKISKDYEKYPIDDSLRRHNEAAKAADVLRRYIKQEIDYLTEFGDPLPHQLETLQRALDFNYITSWLRPMDPNLKNPRRWWKFRLFDLQTKVKRALHSAGRNPKFGIGNDAGPVPTIIAKAIEFISGEEVPVATVRSRLKAQIGHNRSPHPLRQSGQKRI